MQNIHNEIIQQRRKQEEEEGAPVTGAGFGAAAQLKEAEAEAEAAARRTKRLNAVALGGVVSVWVVMSFFIFVYGNIIYSLLGKEAEQSFSTTWGISYAMDNASQWQARPPCNAAAAAGRARSVSRHSERYSERRCFAAGHRHPQKRERATGKPPQAGSAEGWRVRAPCDRRTL